MERLYSLFKECHGLFPDTVTPLTGSASNRRYFRLSAEEIGSVIGVIGTDERENRTFVSMSSYFRSCGISVPEVYVMSDDGMAYIQEDLGDISLSDLISMKGTDDEEVRKLLCRSMADLVSMQFAAGDSSELEGVCMHERFGRRMVMYDLNYFKYSFLKPSGLEFDEDLLQDEFEYMADELLSDETAGFSGDSTFMYRDFNPRNVMIKDGRPYFIDFQGGRPGPVHYDVASFVFHARSGFPADLKNEMLDAYLKALSERIEVCSDSFSERLRLFVLFRLMQVLGAYGFRGLVEHKSRFITSIPAALDELKRLLQYPFKRYPYLNSLLLQLIMLDRFSLPSRTGSGLLVTVYSFSYRKGYPLDLSGNGGGYAFDCRGIHNPGRYEQYKKLTGRDEPVIRFLEDMTEVAGYLDHVYSLVDPHVEVYRDRGFTDLMVSFGCTGGQHRSVYCAQSLACHLAEKYPDISVRLVHREQNIEEMFPPKK